MKVGIGEADMKMSSWMLGVRLALCALLLAVGVPATAGPTRNVLFVGNSFTFYHDVPAMVEALSVAAEDGRPLRCVAFTPGNTTLQDHWETTGARKAIAKAAWEYVVLQEQSQRPFLDPEAMYKYARLLNGDITRVSAKTVFFMTWADKNAPERQSALTRAYQKIGSECGAAVAPVGVAWKYVQAQRPGFELYESDGHHQNAKGSYLAACVFYATLTGKSPVGLPGRLTAEDADGIVLLVNLPAADARFLQQAALYAMRNQ